MVSDEYAFNTLQNGIQTEDIRLVDLLRSNGALSVSAISPLLGIGRDRVYAELNQLVAQGLVEVLQPLNAGHSRQDRGRERDEREYYRWIRITDSAYAWQAALLRKTPEHYPRIERRMAFLLTPR